MDDSEHQLGFELGGEAPDSEFPNLREVREDLVSLLNEARRAPADPAWDHNLLRYKKIVFLQLVRLLPDDEGEQLSFDFLAECERIEQQLAA